MHRVIEPARGRLAAAGAIPAVVRNSRLFTIMTSRAKPSAGRRSLFSLLPSVFCLLSSFF